MALYLRHPLSFEHETGPHLENPERIRAIEQALDDEGWHGLEIVEAPEASAEQLERVHTPAHVESIRRLSESGGGMIDFDTTASARSYEAALRAAGAAAHATDRLLGEGEGFAFCA